MSHLPSERFCRKKHSTEEFFQIVKWFQHTESRFNEKEWGKEERKKKYIGSTLHWEPRSLARKSEKQWDSDRVDSGLEFVRVHTLQ